MVAGISERQHMLITTWQAEAVGITRQVIGERVRRHGWTRYERGVIGWPGPDSPVRRLAAAVLTYARPTRGAERIVVPAGADREAIVDAAAAAAMNAGQVITGRSGAWLHGFAPRPQAHWIWLPSESGRARRENVELRYGGERAGATQWKQGLPVFDPEGCIIETARSPQGTWRQREDEVLWQMSRADSLRLATVDSVEKRLLDMGDCSGQGVLLSAIAKARGQLSHSRSEHRARDLARQALAPLNLEVSERPHEVYLGGRRVGEADIAVLSIRLDVEIDGPHHRFADQRQKDAERDRLMRRAGWEVERYSVELVEQRPHVFKARVRDAAQARLDQA